MKVIRPVTVKTKEEVERQKFIGRVLVYLSLTFPLFFMLPKEMSESGGIAVLALVVGLGFPIIGISLYADAMGRSGAWGLFGFFGFFGMFFVGIAFSLMGALNKEPEQLIGSKVGNKRSGGGILEPFAAVATFLGVIFLVVNFLVHQKVDYVKRSRTYEAGVHARMIHESLVEWQTQSNPKENGFQTLHELLGEDGNPFSEKFPDESELLKSGDYNYSYAAEFIKDVSGQLIPKVTARAKDPDAVRGETIVTLPSGEVVVSKISDSY